MWYSPTIPVLTGDCVCLLVSTLCWEGPLRSSFMWPPHSESILSRNWIFTILSFPLPSAPGFGSTRVKFVICVILFCLIALLVSCLSRPSGTTCHVCFGNGKCWVCNGKGSITKDYCSLCGGTGKCYYCQGTGVIQNSRF